MEDVMCVFIWARAPERRGAAFKKMWIVVSPAAYCKANEKNGERISQFPCHLVKGESHAELTAQCTVGTSLGAVRLTAVTH